VFGYARGWEPVLYVNNIRSYYNILQWLTANEEPASPDAIEEPEAPGVVPEINTPPVELETT
jgi:membrane-bound lytic murein transglycosylase F